MSTPPNQLTKDEKEEVKHALYNSSPLSVKWGDKRPKFTEGKGECEKSELDCYYTVTPAKEWDSMKKYNNFISKHPFPAILPGWNGHKSKYSHNTSRWRGLQE